MLILSALATLKWSVTFVKTFKRLKMLIAVHENPSQHCRASPAICMRFDTGEMRFDTGETTARDAGAPCAYLGGDGRLS